MYSISYLNSVIYHKNFLTAERYHYVAVKQSHTGRTQYALQPQM
jgi:hypothetical protein